MNCATTNGFLLNEKLFFRNGISYKSAIQLNHRLGKKYEIHSIYRLRIYNIDVDFG